MEYGVLYFLVNFGVAILFFIGHVCSFVVGVGKWVGLYSLRITLLFKFLPPPFYSLKVKDRQMDNTLVPKVEVVGPRSG